MDPAAFNRLLDEQVENVRQTISSGTTTEWFLTVVVERARETTITKVVAEGSKGADPIEMLRGFGEHAGSRFKRVDAVFVEAECAGDSEAIMISGCTWEGQVNVAYLAISRDAEGHMLPGPAEAQYFEEARPDRLSGRIPARAVMAGMRAKYDRPWWRLW